MDTLAKVVGTALGIIVLTFVLCLLSTVLGGAVGWVVGLFFEDVILDFLGRFGMDVFGLHVWQIGASLGFIGSFFRSTYTSKS